MTRKTKGKTPGTRRPLPIRAIAVLMAVVMVLSVLYINNRRGVVKADPSITDNTYLEGLLTDKGTYTVNVPASGIEFGLPSLTNLETETQSGTVDLYFKDVDGTTVYYLTPPEEEGWNLAGNTQVYDSYTYAWEGDAGYITSGASAVSINAIQTDTKVYKVPASVSDPTLVEVKVEDAPAPTTSNYYVLNINTYTPSTPVLDVDPVPAVFSDADSEGDTKLVDDPDNNKYYYGDISYDVACYHPKSSDENLTGYSIDEVNDLFSREPKLANGDYTITKKVVKNDTEVYSSSLSKTLVYNYLFLDLAVDYNGDKELKIDTPYALDSSDNYAKDTIEVTGIDPLKDVKILANPFDSLGSQPTPNYTYSIVGGNYTDPVINETPSGIYGHTVKGSGKNSGKTLILKFTATYKDGTDVRRTDDFTVKLVYKDGTPTVDITEPTDGTKVNEDTIDVGADLGLTTDEGATISNVTLYKGTKSTKADASVEESIVATAENPIGTSYSKEGVSLTEGTNYFWLDATSDYGVTTTAGPVSVIYDATAPVVDTTSIAVYDADDTTTPIDVENETLTRTKNYVITFKVSDNLTGVNTVKLLDESENEINCTYDSDSGKWTANITTDPDDSFNDVTKKYTIKATDGVGNSNVEAATTDGDVQLTFVDDNVKVEYTITPDFEFVDPYDLVKWNSNERVTKIYFTATSGADLDASTIVFTVGGKDKTADPNFDDSQKDSGIWSYDISSADEFSKVIDSIYFSIENVHGVKGEKSVASVHVDMTRPESKNVTTDMTWKSSVVIKATVEDPKLEDDDPGSPSGLASASYSISNSVGDITDKTVDVSSGTGTIAQSLPESLNSSGTEFTIKATDKSGNKYEKTFYFCVDATPPTGWLKVNGTDSGSVPPFITGDPVITYEGSDALSGPATDPGVLYINGVSYTGKSGKKLSEIVGTLSPKTDYKIWAEFTDVAGNKFTTDEAKFRTDDKPPVLTSSKITSTSVKNNGYYNGNVSIDLVVEDDNIDATGISLTDQNGKTVSSVWTPTGTGFKSKATITQEGKYTITLKATDKSNNTSSKTFSFTIDKTQPTLYGYLNNVTYDTDGKYYQTDVASRLTVTDTNEDANDVALSVSYKTNDGATESSTGTGKGPHTFTKDGYYEVTYTAVDLAGNSNSKTMKFYVDKTAPVHNLYVTTANPVKTEAYHNTYSNVVGIFTDKADQESYTYGQAYSSDVSIDLGYFDYNLDSITLTDKGVEVPVTWSESNGRGKASITISEEGDHDLKLVSTDKSGNTTNDSALTKRVRFSIDRTAPTVTTYLNDEEYTAMNSYHNLDVDSYIKVDDANPDSKDVTVTITRNIFGDGSTTDVETGMDTLNFYDDGYYVVNYKVVDKAGNSTTKEIGFTVDKVAPVHNLYILTDNPEKTAKYHNNYVNVVNTFNSRTNQENYEYGQYYKNSVDIELNCFDYNIESIYVTDNGTEIKPNWTYDESGYSWATITVSSEGYHEIKMWSRDYSGNETDDVEVGKKVRFYIDTTLPSISTSVNGSVFAEGSGERYLNTNGTVSVSVSDTNKDPDDLTRTVKMTPPGGNTVVNEANISEGSEDFSTEADYEVTYKAVDKAGNVSSTRTVLFRVDKTAPDLSITDVGASSNSSSVNISFTLKEAFYWDMTSATLKIYKKNEGSGETLLRTVDIKPNSANFSISETFAEDAEYRFEFEAEDKCGNKATKEYSFIKDGTAPIIFLSGVENYDKTDGEVELKVTIDEAFYSSNKVTLTGTRTDITGKKNDIEFDGFVTNVSKLSEISQLFKEDGIYDITVTSTDKAGNKSSKSVHFTIDTTAPEIGDISKYDGIRTNSFKWDLDLNDLVTDLTVCEIYLYLDGALYDGVSEIADGSHVLRIEATDELGHTSSKEVTFVIDTIGPNIIVSNVEEGQNLEEQTNVTVSLQLDEDLLDEVTLNGKTISVSDNQATFTVNEKGSYTLTAKAHDEAGNSSSIEMKFSFGKPASLLWVGIVAGIAILLLLLLLVLIRRRRNDN